MNPASAPAIQPAQKILASTFAQLLSQYKTAAQPAIAKFCDRLVSECKGKDVTPKDFTAVVNRIYNDDASMLSIATGLSLEKSQLAFSAVGQSMLTAADKQMVATQLQIGRSMVQIDLPQILSHVAPNQAWKQAVGTSTQLFGSAKDLDQEQVLLSSAEVYGRVDAVEKWLKAKYSDSAVPHNPDSDNVFESPKFSYGQLSKNGGLICCISISGVSLHTPWGEIPVLVQWGSMTDSVRSEITEALSLEEYQVPLSMKMLASMGGAKYYAINKIPGLDCELAAPVFIGEHASISDDVTKTEWKKLRGIVEPELDQELLVQKVATLRAAIEAQELEKQVTLCDEIVAEYGASAVEALIPFLSPLEPAGEDLKLNIIHALEKFAFDPGAVKALKANHLPIAAFIADDLNKEGGPTCATDTLWKVVGQIAPVGAEQFIPLFVKDVTLVPDKNRNQWNCEAMGNFGAAAAEIVPLLKKIADAPSTYGHWPSQYATTSINKIEKALLLQA